MSDIFISYASEDRERVKSLAQALERKGWSVWWDRRIPTGRSFDEVIEEALDASKAVVVVWSQTSVKSQWVKNEAREGLRRRVLLPVMLQEEVKIPLEFRDVQAAHLMNWQLGQEHAGFQQFIDDLVQVIGAPIHGAYSTTLSMLSFGRPSQLNVPPEATSASASPKIISSSLPWQFNEGRLRGSTGTGQSTDSIPYVSIGIGLHVVLVVLVYFLLFSQSRSPVTRDVSPYQPPVHMPSAKTEMITPSTTATLQAMPVVEQGAGSAKTITGKDGAPMVLIPAGEFMMGSRDDDKSAGRDERPAHSVYLDEFYIDQYEVTTSRYTEFLQKTKRTAPAFWSEQVPKQHGRKPVVGVTWNDATAYCFWAEKRLPTEAEWEKAARGTDQRLYPWGNAVPNQQMANYGRGLDFKNYEMLTDVGSYERGKGPYAVHDLAGSVWEWTADWYDENYYGESPSRNPRGPSSGEYRVLRGGSWNTVPDDVRSANRGRYALAGRHALIGFRCVQDVPK